MKGSERKKTQAKDRIIDSQVNLPKTTNNNKKSFKKKIALNSAVTHIKLSNNNDSMMSN